MIGLALVLFQVKHLVVDFLYQPPYMYKNKGTYGHPGGIIHASLHGLATLPILLWLTTPAWALVLSILEIILHYHIDWAKMNINSWRGWGPATNENFWRLLGVDQFMHQITYILLLAGAIG